MARLCQPMSVYGTYLWTARLEYYLSLGNVFYRNAIVIFVFSDLVLIILKGHKVTESDISKTEKQVNMYDMHIGNFLRHPIIT